MVIKDENKSRKWRVQLSYKDIDGKVKRKQKRGFNSKREAQEWERNFLNSLNTTADITFANLTEAYLNDMKHRLKASTMETKVTLIMRHVQPFFAELEIKNITPLVVRSWQSELLKSSYSKTYIKTINNQLSAILNYAVKYYHLPSNPVHIAGTIGKKKADEMNFWTLEEFNTYISVYQFIMILLLYFIFICAHLLLLFLLIKLDNVRSFLFWLSLSFTVFFRVFSSYKPRVLFYTF